MLIQIGYLYIRVFMKQQTLEKIMILYTALAEKVKVK